MSKQTKYSVRDLQAEFPNDEICLAFIFKTLHQSKCSCGGRYSLVKGRKKYQCSKCRFQISPTANTIFHKSATPLSLWFHALFIFSNAKSGISAKEMERQLGVTYKCAWRILDRIRLALKQDNKPLKGIVEIDSTMIGGRGHAKDDNRAHAFINKSVVIAAMERGGRMRAKVMEDSGGKTMALFLKENIASKTILLSDKSPIYGKATRRFKHLSVNHSKGEYVRGKVHINTLENFFGHIKRSVRGTFKIVSKKHLQTYLDSFVWHYNNRGNDRERFSSLLGALLPSSE